jgi:hypothetical protein
MGIGLAELDTLYRDAPGVRFSFGIDLASGRFVPAYADFMQYGDGGELVAVRSYE